MLGDSHEYGQEFDPYHRDDVDDLILGYLRTFFDLPERSIATRWTGVYPVRKGWTHGRFTFPIADRVEAVNGVGGMGMTLSFGLGERHVARWFGGA